MTTNKEAKKKYAKRWREANKERVKENNKIWREKNSRKESQRIWYEANKERVNKNTKRWREVNKDKRKEICSKWREANKERINKNVKERRDKLKLIVFDIYGGAKCNVCGCEDIYKLCVSCVNKEILPKHGRNDIYKWLKHQGYPKGFQIICFDCRRIYNHGTILACRA